MAIYGIRVLVAFTLLFEGMMSIEEADWTKCSKKCNCTWSSGKKKADCTNAGLTSLPTSLSKSIQVVDFSGNNLESIQSKAFLSINLINLIKIYMRDCGIRELHKDAFKGLLILSELNLSDNQIHVIHPGTFKDNIKLRVLLINKNPIQKLEDGTFTDLQHLQTVEMKNCQLSQISPKTFINVTNVVHLKLDGNNLSHMKLASVENLKKLKSLILHHNPWKCDCHLRAFRDWVIDKKLYTQPTACAEPHQLQNELWNQINSELFACKPRIIWPLTGRTIYAQDKEVTLSCKVEGNPSPDVSWVFNTRIIANNSVNIYGDSRYKIQSSSEGSRKWVNLTISRVRAQDRGEFKCVAKNSGGEEERNITLLMQTGSSGGFGMVSSVNSSWPLIIGLVTGMLALLIVVTVICCCYCWKQNKTRGKKNPENGISTNGEVTHHVSSSTEQEKSLLTIPNPIQKPPRRYEAHPSSNNGTELSELNKTLLEEGGSVIAWSFGAEGDHSGGSREDTPQRLRDKSESEPYPPDLLAFPGRRSPAIHSPVHSSLYHGFGTLPYSRSQSPFTPVAPVVRQGYVTIPRRPRVPSWSSAPTPSLEDSSLLRPEPVYDNLGPRTTADGSSAQSLNHNIIDGCLDDRGHRPLPSLLFSSEPRGRQQGDFHRVSSEDPIPSSTPRPKIAPKPPPKPKKNGPLYEDEGEDGTEV